MRRTLYLLMIVAVGMAPTVQAMSIAANHGDCRSAMEVAASSHDAQHPSAEHSRNDHGAPSLDCQCGCDCSIAHGCTSGAAALPPQRPGAVVPSHESAPLCRQPPVGDHDRIPPLRPPIPTSC